MQQLVCECELVVFDERFAYFAPLCFLKGVGHSSTDEQRIHFAHQIANDADLVGYFGAAQDCYKRTLWVL